MTTALVTALIDTLLPGELAASRHALPLPPGSSLGLKAADHVVAFRGVLQAIVDHSGGVERFLAAGADERLAILESVNQLTGGRLRELAMALLQDYCESPGVLQGLSTPSEPPQPGGREVQATDAATLELLERVRARGRIWR